MSFTKNFEIPNLEMIVSYMNMAAYAAVSVLTTLAPAHLIRYSVANII